MKQQNRKKAFITAVALAMVCMLGALSLAGCGSSGSGNLKLVNSGKLTVISDCDYPPFIQLNGSTPSGFEYDLMSAIAKKMGLEVNYLAPQKFDTIITTIKSGGKADCGVSSFTINSDRAKEIDFTDPYFDSNQGVVALKSSGYTSAADLAGLKVAAQSGTTGQTWAEENIPGCQMVPLDAATECFEALESGQVQAVVLDLPTAKVEILQSFTDANVIQEVATGEQYGIVVSKSNTALKDAINKALGEIKSDGTYASLMNKYSQYFK